MAVVACLSLAGPLALPAQAQTTNFYLWRTTLTVGESNDYLGYSEIENWGELSTSATFNYPPWSPPHKHHFDPDYEFTVEDLFLDDSGNLNLIVDGSDNAPGTNVGEITLWIRNSKFPLVNFGANGTGQYGFRASSLPSGPDLDWKEGDTVRVVLTYTRLLPSAPENVQVTAPTGEDGTLEVSWDAADAGTFPIECYLVEFRHPSGEAKKRKQSYPGSRGTGKGCGDEPPTSVTRTDLEPDVRYEVLVQALSGDGFSEWSDMKTARTSRGRALGARFVSPPERHDGTNRIKVRVAFSEAPENVGADGVEVEGGRVTSVSPVGGNAPGGAGNRSAGGRNAGREDREVVWEFEIEPDSDGDVTVSIEAGRACDEPGAICTADGRSLSEDISTTVEGPPPLTASFEDVPAAHDGESAFTLRMASSDRLSMMNGRRLREDVVAVSGGRATAASRVNRRRDLWELTVEPDSLADVTVTVAAEAACGTPAAVCTKDGRALSNTISATIPGPAALDFAHFAKGATITSEMVLVNAASHPSRPAIYFYDTKGDAIPAESVVDVTGDLEVTEDGALTVRTEMEPLEALTISTHGRGEPVSGSVTVLSDGPIGGVVRYSVPEIGVAGVGPSPPVNDALFPVRRQAGGIRTAAALHNLEAEAMGVRCRLMSGGVALEEVEIHLEANGQTSWFIEDAFTATDTSDFGGSVRCTAPGNGRFTAVALEMDAANRIFTTLPVVPVDPPGSGNQQTTLDFAHFANGTGITSEMVFLNPSTQPSRPAVYFYDTEGDAIPAESVVDVTGDLEVTEDGGLTVWTEMEPLGVLTISTHGRGELVTGSARVVSDGPIGGLLSFDLPGVGAGVVGASPPLGDALFPVRRQEGGINTWAAIHNLESSAGLVRCDLMREGVLLDAVSIPLEANGQTSWFIDQAFPAADTSDFAGSVRCDAVGEGRFSAVALEMDPGNRIFTTLPVVPVPEMPSQE